MFTYETVVKLHHTDAAGLLFFAHQFSLAHDAYQSFMEANELGFGRILRDGAFKLPIVRAESDYPSPLFVDDRLTIELTAEKVSTHSFVLLYRFVGEDDNEVGKVRTVHVCVNNEGRKMPLPDNLRQAMESVLE